MGGTSRVPKLLAYVPNSQVSQPLGFFLNIVPPCKSGRKPQRPPHCLLSIKSRGCRYRTGIFRWFDCRAQRKGEVDASLERIQEMLAAHPWRGNRAVMVDVHVSAEQRQCGSTLGRKEDPLPTCQCFDMFARVVSVQR